MTGGAGKWKGLLVVLSAPSGAGKGTLRRALTGGHPEIRFCPSVTTRKPRPGEVDGVDYYFVDLVEFQRMIDRGDLVEWANVYGNMYGTPREPMETWLGQGYTAIVEKDVQGARSLREVYPDAVYVFVMPPSFEELKRRVQARGTETPCEIQRRLQCYREEVAMAKHYDYIIVNDDIKEAARVLESIIVAEKCRVKRCGVPGGLDCEGVDGERDAVSFR